eukprot:3589911-Rhodomonas_salina.1
MAQMCVDVWGVGGWGGKREGGRQTDRQTDRQSESVCLCVCVSVCLSRVSVSVSISAWYGVPATGSCSPLPPSLPTFPQYALREPNRAVVGGPGQARMRLRVVSSYHTSTDARIPLPVLVCACQYWVSELVLTRRMRIFRPVLVAAYARTAPPY